MTATKSTLSLVLAMTLLTGQFLLAGCSSGTTTSAAAGLVASASSGHLDHHVSPPIS
jgi:uncharacterized lipoprotein YajG